MESKDYLKDLNEIKDLMNKSSRFISLSGLSGVLAGIYALVGAYIAYGIIYLRQSPTDDYNSIVLYKDEIKQLFTVAFIVLTLSILTGITLSWKKAQKNFLIPLATGGFVVLFMIEKDVYLYVAPMTLIFYGLSLVNASKYTLGYVRYLGVSIILIGLVSSWFLSFGLFFWALGFGICHIIYGILMHNKYDRH
jgi:hypothetical protein